MKFAGIKKSDLYLVGVLLLLALGCLFLMQVMKESGTRVVVYADGVQDASFPLDSDREYLIHAGGGENLLVIENGAAYLKDADCPDKLCVGMGKIRYDGQTIVCLPHKLVVAVEGGEKDPGSGSEDEGIDVIAR